MADVGSITIEVRPTVTLESAAACVMMLNLFFADNEGYRLARRDGEWYLTDEPPMRGARGGDLCSGRVIAAAAGTEGTTERTCNGQDA
jgi:hypothetical protein